MERHFKHLSEIEQNFIDLVYIQFSTFDNAAQMLNINYSDIQQFNKELEKEWRPIIKIRDKWKSKKIEGNFWDFYNWIKTVEECCHYCGITQSGLDRLHEIGISNKRNTRGRTLEIDRKEPNESYSNINNLTYSCYWCNNAKTDTFTEDEFLKVGKVIAEIWNQRLKNDNR